MHGRDFPSKPRVRLEFLDGIRGWAALYVVFFHLGSDERLDEKWPLLFSWRSHGALAVTVFIVLSGFCLMLPVVRDPEGRLSGGFVGYIKRRARRILPPYYAALLFAVVAILLNNVLVRLLYPSSAGDPSLTPANIATHLLLIHNGWLDYNQSLNPALWSVATEWQIYFLFPFLLLPVWRRYGIWGGFLAGMAVGLLPVCLLPSEANFSWARPWYLGIFAMGMGAAAVCFSDSPAMERLRTRVAWGWSALGAWIIWGSLAMGDWKTRMGIPEWCTDTIVGAGTVCTILALAGADAARPAARIRGFLENQTSLWLGAFSYSIYLVHQPATYALAGIAKRIDAPLIVLGFRWFVMIPFAVAFSRLFYHLVERHFVASPKKAKSVPQHDGRHAAATVQN
jgi:peptidoglycan/LPS O-acetylase OafA/YrhL